jgi:solute carrier family 15 (oligopeptide transporter), member 1
MDNQPDLKDPAAPAAPPAANGNGVTEMPPAPGPLGVGLAGEAAMDQQANAIVRFFQSHPKGFWFFFWGEFAERCSYYGMRAILSLYMADQLGLGEANAATYMSFFIAACYFLPLVGGYVADNFFGKYWTIVGFSIPYILGHVILGFESFWFLVIALSLLAMGSGVIKPNISTLMGLTYDQYRPGQKQLRSDAFAIFYFAINFGAAISQFAMPPIRTHYGYWVAFLFPAALMAIAFVIFTLGKPYYAVETINRNRPPATPEERHEMWLVLRNIAGLFVLVMFFWSIFDQSASTWIFFANLYMDCRIFGWLTDPDQIQAFNPVFIILLLPFITVLWRVLEKRGLKIRATDKMVVGFLLTAMTMGVMALSAALAGGKEEQTRLVLKNGDVKFTSLQLVFNESVVELSDGTLTAKDGKYTVKSGWVVGLDPMPKTLTGPKSSVVKTFEEHGDLEALIKGGALTLAHSEGVWEGRAAELKDGELKITKAQLFIKDGVITTPDGTATIKDGKVEKADGALQVKDGKAVKEAEGKTEAVLQPDSFVRIQNKVSVWWQVFAYLIITVAEVLISVTGLELAYAAAPKRMTSFVTACWLLTVSLANLLLNAPVTRLYPVMAPAAYFGMLSVTLLAVTGIFVFVARNFNRVVAEQEAKTAALVAAADGAANAAPQGPTPQGVTDPRRIQ